MIDQFFDKLKGTVLDTNPDGSGRLLYPTGAYVAFSSPEDLKVKLGLVEAEEAPKGEPLAVGQLWLSVDGIAVQILSLDKAEPPIEYQCRGWNAALCGESHFVDELEFRSEYPRLIRCIPSTENY